MLKKMYYIFFALASLCWALSATDLQRGINDLDQPRELASESIDKKQPQSELFKLLAELDYAQISSSIPHSQNGCIQYPLSLKRSNNLEEKLHVPSSSFNDYNLLPVSCKHQSAEKAAHACSTAFALYQFVGKNCLQAAYKLHKILNEASSHTYLRSVLNYHFTRAHSSSHAHAQILEDLATNAQFCSDLKHCLSPKKITGSQDLTCAALRELHKQLHYYTWLKALNHSQKSFSTSPFYTEDFKGLSENLRLIIWSMINDVEK